MISKKYAVIVACLGKDVETGKPKQAAEINAKLMDDITTVHKFTEVLILLNEGTPYARVRTHGACSKKALCLVGICFACQRQSG